MAPFKAGFPLAAAALLLAACATEPPLNPALARPQFSQAAGAGPAGYLILFKKDQIPSGFTAAVSALGGTVTGAWAQTGIAAVTGLSADAATTLGRRSDVEQVEPDQTLQLDPEVNPVAEAVSAAAMGSAIASAANPATAFFFPRQWNLRAIHADQAWAAGKLGSPAVTVAILDTGIDYAYIDLVGRVDLTRSVSFIPSDDALVAAFFPGRHPVTDLHFHGTHVASIVTSNALAVAGVTSQVTLMGVKVCDVFGSCPTSAVLGGILYAADHGADVANLSLGGSFVKAGAKGFNGFINRVFTYAQRQGMLVVVAAGNGARDLDHDGNVFNAYCDAPSVVCVAATGPASGGTAGPWPNPDQPTTYTSFGRSAIDVAAPGGTSAAFVWGACSTASLQVPQCQTGIFTLGVTGTSEAAPHVSGVAALLIGRYGSKNPQRIRTLLQQTADDINGKGTDPYSGKGRVNAARAAGAIP